MRPKPVTFDPTKAFGDVTFNVDVVVKWTWRIRLGLWLIHLGCWLVGMKWGESDDNS